ncbi:MAG: hypothetical protein IPK32_07950 [Verrucomicrobiaceae bacterium]|nr:hypothetical protein [Verrucomicrobiaceae bacterium]
MNPKLLIRLAFSAASILTAGLLASCAGVVPSSAPMASRQDVAGGSHAYAAKARSSSYAEAMPAAPPSPADRPGLGTEAGHDHYSHLAEGRLIRKSSAPDAVDSFHYNDEKGAKAMANVLGGGLMKHSGLFDVAGGRLEAGLARYGRIYPHYEASGRRVVIGEAGEDYRVRLRNRSKKRVEVVLSVDGLNTLTGKAASPSQHGYILEPGESYDVDGFRKNASTVSTFRFGRVADALASKKGGAANVGVIGLAVFEEDESRAKMELQREQFVRDHANAFPSERR